MSATHTWDIQINAGSAGWSLSPINWEWIVPVNVGDCSADSDVAVFTVTNESTTTPMVITVSTDNNDFQIQGSTTYPLLPGSFVYVPIRFCPTSSGTITGTFTATSDVGSPPSLSATLTGHGAGNYVLSTTVNPSVGGTVSLNPPGGSYQPNTSVQLTATQNSIEYTFDYWSGDLIGTSNPATILMDGDKTVVAHFKSNTVTTCYGCRDEEVVSDTYPLGTTCSDATTPGYPYPSYISCAGKNWMNYLLYAGIGLAVLGVVVYVVRRKPTQYYLSPPIRPAPMKRTTARRKPVKKKSQTARRRK